MTQQCFEILAIARVNCHPDTDPDSYGMGLHPEILLKSIPYLLNNVVNVLLVVDVFQNWDKFVTAQPRYGISSSHIPLSP